MCSRIGINFPELLRHLHAKLFAHIYTYYSERTGKEDVIPVKIADHVIRF
jgi:hypothetical protein